MAWIYRDRGADVVLARMEHAPGVLHATWEVSTRD
ncbi:uncharacterized membrane protein YqaE (UPF0057 family) [Stenotrophomonas sp. AN71]